jgi:hypothetical protein
MTGHLGRRVLGATAGLLCGSVLWALNTQLGEILPYPECRLRLPFTGPGSSLALIASLIAGYWSWRVWLSLWDQRDARASDTDRSLRLLAAIGVGAALIFALALALQGAAGFILSGCER